MMQCWKKKKNKLKELEDDRLLAEHNKKEFAMYLKQEEDKKIARKLKNAKYRQELDAFAIQKSKQNTNEEGMVDTELQINGDVIKMVTKDKSLYDKIQDRLHGGDPLRKKKVDKSKAENHTRLNFEQ